MITLKDFSPDNIPIQKQVEDLGQFMLENFQDEIGNNGNGNGEGAIEMSVRLLLELKEKRKLILKENKNAKKELSQKFMSFCKDYCKEFISIDRRDDIRKAIEALEK